MKNIVLYTLLTLLLISCFFGGTVHFTEKDAKDKENLIHNNSFELITNNTDQIFDGWVLLNDKNKNHVFIDNETSFNGENSVRFNCRNEKITLISEPFEINPNYAYYTRLYLSSQDLLDGVIINFVTFDDSGNRIDKFTRKVKVNDEWQLATLDAIFLKNNAKYARFLICIPPDMNNKIWIDNTGVFEIYKLKQN